jgi:pilus assembly protein CpaE
MFPLKVVGLDVDDSLLPEIRRELLNMNAELSANFRSNSSLVELNDMSLESAMILIMQINTENQLRELKRLSSQLPNAHILAIVKNTIDNYGIANIVRFGACQVVMLPFSIRDFRESINRIAVQFGHNIVSSRVICVSGCQGGVGASSLAFNLAYEISILFGKETILIESPGSYGTIATFLNLDAKFTSDDLVRSSDDLDVYRIKEALTSYSKNLSILPASKHLGESNDVCIDSFQRILKLSRQLADVVIIDLQTKYQSLYRVALDNSDKQVLIGEQTIPSINVLHEKLIGTYAGYCPTVVISKYDKGDAEIRKDSITNYLDSRHVFTIANDHACFCKALNTGTPLRFSNKRSKALDDIEILANHILEMPVKTKNVQTSILEGLASMIPWRTHTSC